MEYRPFGRSGLKVPVLSFGTATFGGTTPYFKTWGTTDTAGARSLIDRCLDVGICLFDTSDIYSRGESERILGQAIEGRRDRVLISTKATFSTGKGPNDYGSSRHHLIEACDASLKRLGTDHIDIYHMHGADMLTPVEETLRALDDLVRAGKIRYIAASNFSAWHLMKSLALSDRYGWTRYIGHQANYSLVSRELEHEHLPLCVDQGVGTMVWSPLAGGALSGKIRRDQPAPADSRLGQSRFIPYDDAKLFDLMDVLEDVAKACGKTIPQVALNWLLNKPSVSTILIGARDSAQLEDNLGAIGWTLDAELMARLDAASEHPPTYPYWHQAGSDYLNRKSFEI